MRNRKANQAATDAKRGQAFKPGTQEKYTHLNFPFPFALLHRGIAKLGRIR